MTNQNSFDDACRIALLMSVGANTCQVMPKNAEWDEDGYIWLVKVIAMKTSRLQKAAPVDDGECLSFHSIPVSSFPAVFRPSGFELLLLPAGAYRLSAGGEAFLLAGPQLMLMGPGLTYECSLTGMLAAAGSTATSESILATQSLRWPADLLGTGFLDKTQLKAIGGLLEQASRGVCFPPGAVSWVGQRMTAIRQATGFTMVLGLLALLNDLSGAAGQPMLSAPPPAPEPEKKSPMDEAMAFMEANYFLPMTLEEMARKACMTKGSFCRSFRQRTGKTYGETLNEIRLGHICRMLVETADTVSEIAYRAGYQNIFHFHRHFKREKGCTPKEYRQGRRAG